MITIKTEKEIEILREGGKRLAIVLYGVKNIIKPNVATAELDELAEKLIKKAGGRPSFKNYKTKEDGYPFPASLCVSINNEIVHGIPLRDKILREGDIVSLDLGMEYKNLYTDMAITVGVGKISKEAEKIIKITERALLEGIKAARENNFIGDISSAIQECAEKNGFNVVRQLVGHGVGYKIHEMPDIPNFGTVKTREKLKTGMILALEPMLVAGQSEIILDTDGWTWKTKDGSLSAHFEHTIVITEKSAEVLTKI